MKTNKDLNRDSSTKDLLKFATEHGYHDNEGMDNSPSWMSQELDERAFAESKVRKNKNMTTKTKQLEKAFVKLMTDMGATFVDVTPQKDKTEHIADIVKKVDWEKRIRDIVIQNQIDTRGCPCDDCINRQVKHIKQLLFEYGEFIIGEDEENLLGKTESIFISNYEDRDKVIVTLNVEISNKLRNKLRQKNKEVLR